MSSVKPDTQCLLREIVFKGSAESGDFSFRLRHDGRIAVSCKILDYMEPYPVIANFEEFVRWYQK